MPERTSGTQTSINGPWLAPVAVLSPPPAFEPARCCLLDPAGFQPEPVLRGRPPRSRPPGKPPERRRRLCHAADRRSRNVSLTSRSRSGWPTCR